MRMKLLYYNCTVYFSFAQAGHRGTCLRPLHIFALLCFAFATHGQKINLPVCVCVCVCVSVTFSVKFNSPTGQTPQRIFTVNSLKDADLRKDVPFEGLDDE